MEDMINFLLPGYLVEYHNGKLSRVFFDVHRGGLFVANEKNWCEVDTQYVKDNTVRVWKPSEFNHCCYSKLSTDGYEIVWEKKITHIIIIDNKRTEISQERYDNLKKSLLEDEENG